MYQIIIAIHMLLGVGVIGLVLMQQGKGADAGASFGTGSAGSVFGAQGAASFLSRTTAILATLFFITSLTLSIMNSHKGAAYDLMNPSADNSVDLPEVGDVKKPTTIPQVITPPVTKVEKVESPAPAATVEKTTNTVKITAVEKQSAPLTQPNAVAVKPKEEKK